ncbi:MAG: formylglycine-generating enzyme family protein [Gammaproteobacteria bacterium]
MKTEKPSDHSHTEKKCNKCHTDDFDVIKLLEKSRNDCLRCHTDDRLIKALSETTQKKTFAGESELKAFIPDKKISLNDGMRFELYPDKTRLGDAPNEMKLIPAGPFIRGTDSRLFDEGPQHNVDVGAFFIDIYEVTNAQYKKYLDDTGRRAPTHFKNRSYPQGKADHPVTYVSWKNAKSYCEWAGKRLPTDIEWEKAARGTDGRQFPWGDVFEINNANTPVRWEALNRKGDTTPVGSFTGGISPYGIYDMTGNVWEWTSSWYEAYPGNTSPSENYGHRYKTLKGGSWFDCSFYKCGLSAPVYNRSFFSMRTKNDSFGFRCAKDADLKK